MYLIVLAALAALTVLMAGQDVALTVALAVVGALALTPSDGLAGSADPSANPKVACETAALTQYSGLAPHCGKRFQVYAASSRTEAG